MKRTIVIALLGLFLFAPVTAEAQVLKKLKKKVERKAEKKVDKEIDKALEGKKEDPKEKEKKAEKKEEAKTPQDPAQEGQKPVLNWAKYDFVPGDEVIFEDNLVGEENGEFPSRWDLVDGATENAEFGGEPIIMFRGGHPEIIPYMKNAESDYLPEIFTVEFDLYLNNPNSFQVFFYDRKNQRASAEFRNLDIRHHGMNLAPAGSRIPDNGSIQDKWAHIAIAYTKGKLKAYIDETRLINIPRLAFDPMGISLRAYSASDDNKFYVKNFRIAKGGVKYYDRVLQDGKIVANGIRFDVNKATLKPESMGVINSIASLMEDHPDLKFSVEGHTDSDGDEGSNQKLSEERAQTVLNTLVALGISADRLTTKGWGESTPVDTNDTPEGKANNRRVEFVKVETLAESKEPGR